MYLSQSKRGKLAGFAFKGFCLCSYNGLLPVKYDAYSCNGCENESKKLD